MNEAETLFEIHLKELKQPFEREVLLAKGRKFRWDFVVDKLAIEIQGGIWMKKGAHNTGKAIQRDIKKGRLAVMAGYTPIYFTSDEVLNGTAIAWIKNYEIHIF